MEKLKALEQSAKWNADNFEPVTVAGTKDILAIAEAFRSLDQRAEAAEAKLKAATESRDRWKANAHEFSRCADRLEEKLADYAKKGWQLVPVEPTEGMVIAGFDSEPDESFSTDEEWEAYEAMSGCQQAAHRAKLCYAAMLAAAPELTSD